MTISSHTNRARTYRFLTTALLLAMLFGAAGAPKLASAATPTIDWTDPADITYGTALSTVQLNATANISGVDEPGTFTYTPDFDAVLPAGVSQTLSVHFVPTDGANDPVDATVSINVTRAPLSITADDQTKRVGTPNPTLTASYNGFVNSDDATSLIPPVSLSTSATTASPAGTYPIVASAAANPNYAITFVNGTLTVTPKQVPVITWADPADITYGTALDTTQLNATADVTGTFSYDQPEGTVLDAGDSQTLSLTFTPGDSDTYAEVQATAAINVARAALTITADDGSKVYGDGLPSFGATSTGLVDGDTLETLDTPLDFSTTASDASDVGPYTITPSATDANYDITPVDGTLTVTRAPLSITADDQTKRVGTPNPSLSASYNGFVNGDDATSLIPPVNLSTSATTASPAGIYTIVAIDAANPNYDITFVNGTLTVTPKLVPVITWADPADITYGTALGATQLNATADVTGTFSYDQPAGTVLDAGDSQTVHVYFTPGDSDTYAEIKATATINVARAALTITADDASKVYGDGLPSFGATSTGLVDGDTLETLDTPLDFSTTASDASDVGPYTITPSAADPNYTITVVDGTLTVTRAPLSITADDQTKRVGTPNPSLSASYNGFVNGDDETSLIPPVNLSTSATTASPVGIYTIVASAAANSNYTITFVNGRLEVTAKQVPVISWSNPAAITYGTALDATQLNATADVAGTFSYDQPEGTVLDAGNSQTMSLTFTPGDSATYASVSQSVSIDVLPAPLAIAAVDDSKVYGAGLPSFSATSTGLVNGDTLETLTPALILDSDASTASDVGTYTITPIATDPNYDITIITGTLTVTPAPLTIIADDQAKVAGSPNPALTATYIGFVNGDDETSLIPPVDLSTPALTVSVAGTYPIAASGALNPNYDILFIAGTLTVTDKQVPVISWSNPAAITYGTALGATQLNATANVPGTFTYTPTTGMLLNAGSSQSLHVDFTPTDGATYATVEANASIDVTPAPLTITADNKTKLYGAGLPAFSATSTGLVNGDTLATLATPLAFNSGATAASTAGSYAITPSAADPNYTITAVDGTLTVTRAPLTITADNQTKRVGSPNPVLTASYSGFVNGDDETKLIPPVSLSTSATTASPAGTYPIVASAAVNPNYTITFVNGTLTVTPKQVPVITWSNPAPITYGTALGATQLNATASVPGTFAYTPAAGVVLNAGSSRTLGATFTPTDAATYATVAANASIDVNQAALTIRADNKTKVAGTDNPALTAIYTGFVNGDTAASLDTPAVLATTAIKTSPEGVYPISVSGATDANYTITLVAGSLTVTPGAPAVDPKNGTVAAPDSYFLLSAGGFTPNTLLTIAVNGKDAGTVRSDANGVATFLIFFSSRTLPGAYTIVVTEDTPTLSKAAISVAATRTAQIVVTIDPSAPKLVNPGGVPVLTGQPSIFLPKISK